MANVMPAWLGAISAWLLRCPEELHALKPIDTEISLYKRKKNVMY